MLASALSIKPIIEVRDGKVEQGGKQRTRSKALAFLVEKLVSYGKVDQPRRAARRLQRRRSVRRDAASRTTAARSWSATSGRSSARTPVAARSASRSTRAERARRLRRRIGIAGVRRSIATSVRERTCRPTTSPPPLPPAVLAQRYRLERRLAQGGMAEVWLGTDLSLSRQVAIKLLEADARQRSDRRRTVPPRGHRGRPAEPPEHRRGLRRDRRQRSPSGGHAAGQRQEPAPVARRAEAAQPRPDDPHRLVRGQRARRRAPRRHGAPRRQARQHPHHARRPRAADRLRHRQGPRVHRRRPDQRQHHDGHGQVPVARAGARQAARRSRRPVLARPGAVRVPRRACAVPRPDRRRHRARSLATRPDRSRPACARRCPTAWPS